MTHSVFQGRSFLAEKDFSRAELEYLIGLSAHLKDKAVCAGWYSAIVKYEDLNEG